MNKSHKHAELIKAWADGAEIQMRQLLNNENWIDINLPFHESFIYRIKPKKITVWDWLVKTSSTSTVGYYPGYSEESIKALYPDGEIFQRIDGTEKEIEI